MADKKIAASLVNVIKFDLDRASMQRAMKAIKDVKKAMSDVTAPFNAAKRYTNELKRQTAELQKQKAIINSTKSATSPVVPRTSRTTTPRVTAEDKAANKADKFTSRRDADQFFFRSKFGRGGERRFNKIAQEFSAGKISAEMYATKIRLARGELYAAQRAQRGFNQSIRDMRSAFIAATASYTAFAGVMGIANIGKKYQGYQSAMTMAFGSQQEAANQTQFAMNETYRLGLSPSEAMDNYSKLAVASKGKISTNDLQGLFSGYSEYAKVAGASQERISNGVVAMQQMLSKGRITAEEFRSQLNLADYKSI